jgi:hypothetical protein
MKNPVPQILDLGSGPADINDSLVRPQVRECVGGMGGPYALIVLSSQHGHPKSERKRCDDLRRRRGGSIDGIVTALCLRDIVRLLWTKSVTTGGVSRPIRAIYIGQSQVDDVSEAHLNRLEREMETLSYSRIPKVEPMGRVGMEPGCTFIRFPSLRRNRTIERGG